MTYSAKHTPGPWYAEKDPDHYDYLQGLSYWRIKPDKFASDQNYLHIDSWMSEENARLIAAAPDLLSACIDAFHIMPTGKTQEMDEVCKILEAAIRKAMKLKGDNQ